MTGASSSCFGFSCRLSWSFSRSVERIVSVSYSAELMVSVLRFLSS